MKFFTELKKKKVLLKNGLETQEELLLNDDVTET